MRWQALILAQTFLVAVSTIITRYLARDKKTAGAAFAITASWFVILYIVGLIALPYLGQLGTSSFHNYWPRFILSGTAFALSNVFNYKMLVYLDAAVGTIFGTLSVFFTVAGATLFLHEDLSSLQIVGASILLSGIVYTALATRHRPTKEVHRNLMYGFLYAFVTSVFYAIAALNEKSLLNHVSVGDYVLFGWLWQMIAVVVLAVLIQPKAFKLLKKPNVFSSVLALGILRGTSGMFFILALVRSNNVGLVTVISNFKIIIVVLLGLFFLKETQKTYQKIIGSAISTFALILMFWQN